MASRLEVEHIILEKLIDVCAKVDSSMMACIEGRGDIFYGSRDPVIKNLVDACGDAQRYYIWARMNLKKLDAQEAEWRAERARWEDEGGR